MAEKVPEHISRPGVPEALDPAIGNGALWEINPHQFNLKSVDPTISLDALITDEAERQTIIAKWSGLEDLTQEMDFHSNPTYTSVIPEEPKKDAEKSSPIENQDLSGNEIQQTLPGARDEENLELIPELDSKPSLSSPDVTESIESKISIPEKSVDKVGKRVRKVVKKAKKEKEKLLKIDPPATEPVSEAGQLSEYTQWLKSLRGSEYVHPYEDDYGLEQMSPSARGGVSETFAELLVAQGYRDQAREMYLQLMEKYPEKSSFFAAKIEALT